MSAEKILTNLNSENLCSHQKCLQCSLLNILRYQTTAKMVKTFAQILQHQNGLKLNSK